MAAFKTAFVAGMASIVMTACGNTAETTTAPIQGQSVKSDPQTSPPMTSEPSMGNGANYARDGNIAIQEEFQDAEIKGTVAAYEMFIARHPDHELSNLAKIRISEIKSKDNQ